MVEYSLTLALVLAMGSIGALTALGESVSSNFGLIEKALVSGMNAINPDMAAAWVSTDSLSNSSGSSDISWTSWTSPGTSTARSSSAASTISQETLANQAAGDPAYAPASHIILVSGANGATHYLASTLTKQADALLAQGSITQAQANQLYQLANAGHDLAKAQLALENALANGQTSVNFGGKTYNLQNFADQMSFVSASQQKIWNMNPANTHPLLTPFAQQYVLVKQSDLMQNPQVAALVNNVSMQIGSLSDAISWSFCNSSTCKPTTTLEGFKTTTAAHFNENMDGAPMSSVDQIASKGTASFTNTRSGEVCKKNAGTDTGTQCGVN